MEKLEIFQFKNTGFEGFVQVKDIKVEGKPVAFAVPAMDAGAVCWFPFEISKDLANKERASRKTLFCDFFSRLRRVVTRRIIASYNIAFSTLPLKTKVFRGSRN